mgnify:CR=1 FL=1
MFRFKKFGITLLSALIFSAQLLQLPTVKAEDAAASEKLELTAENEQIDSADEEALSMDDLSEEDSDTVADPSENLTYVTFDAAISEGVSKEGNTYIWHANSNASGHGVSYRVNYSISGRQTLPANSVQIDIPLQIIRDRNGELAGTYEMSLPTDEEFEETHYTDPDTIFAYTELDRDGDGVNETLRVYNKVECTSGQQGYFELAYYTSKPTMEYADMSVTDPFKATMSIGTKSWQSDEIPFTIDTSVYIESANKNYLTKYTSWQSKWGDAVRPADDEKYLYIEYPVKSTIYADASQKYTFTLNSTASSDSGDVEIIGYRFGNTPYQAENHIDVQTMADSRWDYVLLKYEKEKFSPLDKYKITATIKPTVTPVDGIDPVTSKSVTYEYVWEKPVFGPVTPRIGFFEHGNGTWENDTEKLFYWDDKGVDYGSSKGRDYERYDLDDFQKGIVTSLDDIRFITHSNTINGYWTVPEGEDRENPENYYKEKVTSAIESGIKFLEDISEDTKPEKEHSHDFTTEPLTSEDFEIRYLTYKITNEYRILNSETMKYDKATADTYDDETVYTFYAKYGNVDSEWVKAGTFKPSTRSPYITDTEHVESITGDRIVFKDGSGAVEYKIETSNASYRTAISADEFLTLKNSDRVMEYVKDRKVAYISNVAHLDVTDAKGNNVESLDMWDFDRIIQSQRNSTVEKRAVSSTNNRKKKQSIITWRVNMTETLVAGTGVETTIPQNGGIFYDLLPEGATFDDESVYITDESGSEISDANYTVSTEDNFRGSNRILLKVDITKTSNAYNLYYDTVHSWNSIKDYGTKVVNPVAYETKNDRLSNGYYDDPTKPYDSEKGNAFDDEKLNKLFKDLSTRETEEATFIYAQSEYDILAITSGSAGLSKKVLGDSQSDFANEAQTHTGGEYSYKLRYQNTFSSKAGNLIFFDSLENYETAEGKTSDWHGTLTGIGLNQLYELGVDPAVYISTVENLDMYQHHDLTDASVWTQVDDTTDLSAARAVAIDARKAKDGSNFVLQPGESLTAYLYMKAPDTVADTEGYPYAYNNIWANSTLYRDTLAMDYFVHQDYTSVRCVITGDFSIKKVNRNNTDEVISGIKYRLYGTSDYGTAIDEICESSSEGMIKFKAIEKGTYTLQEYDSGEDWILDPTEYTVTIDENGNTSVENGDYSQGVLTVTDEPRVHGDLNFSKKNLVTQKNIRGAKFLLQGTSDYGTSVTQYATSYDSGNVTFSDIEKGTYDLTEVSAANGYVPNGNKYRVTIDDSGSAMITLKDGDRAFLNNTEKVVTVYNEPLHKITIVKQNSYDYSAVEGVTFRLSGTSDRGTAVDISEITDSAGLATFNGLESGTYTLVETAVAENADGINVELDTTPRAVTVDKYGNVTIVGNQKDSQGNTIIVDNAKSDKTVTVIKKFVDEETKDHSKDLPTIHLSTNKPDEATNVTIQGNDSIPDPLASTSKAKARRTATVQEEETSSDAAVMSVSENGRAADNPDWYMDWDCEVDDTNNAILLKAYKGEETAYEIPSSAVIDGVKYTTMIGNWSGDMNADVDVGVHASSLATGTIQNLSFEPGIKIYKSDLAFLLEGNTTIRSVDFSGLDTAGVGSFNSMLRDCSNLEHADFTGFNTSLATNFVYMFKGCTKLTDLDLSCFDTSSMIYMYGMFWDCESLTSLDLSSFNTSKVTNMIYTFYGCRNLEMLDISSFDTAQVYDMSYMFADCRKLAEINVSHFNTSNVNNFRYMFQNCKAVKTLDVSSFDTSEATRLDNMFAGCSAITELDLTNFNTSQVTVMSQMFYDCANLKSIDVSSFDTSQVTTMGSMFSTLPKLETLDVSHFDTSKVTSMFAMFYGCKSLRNLDVSHFDTSKVTDMSSMFRDCAKLAEINVSNFNTSALKLMPLMFRGCASLKILNVDSFDTRNVTNMQGVFYMCSNLESVNVSHFDTSKVTTLQYLFYGCAKLKSVNVTGFNTSKVTNFGNMFGYCSSLTKLDISNFNVAKAKKVTDMLTACKSLEELKLFAPTADDPSKPFQLLECMGYTNGDGYTVNASSAVKLKRIRIMQGSTAYSTQKAVAYVSQLRSNSMNGYTGNWTAISEYNHKNGSKLTADCTVDGNSYVSLQASYASITAAQWKSNRNGGIWFVWEKEGMSSDYQDYTSIQNNYYTPEYDKNGNVMQTPEQKYPEDGYWQKIGDSTYAYTFYVIDSSKPFYVWEDLMDGYTSSNTATNPIYIINGTQTAVITNTSTTLAKTGSLTVTKTVVDSSTTQKFPFTITLTKADGSALSGTKVFGTTAFKDGVAKVSLANGENLTISDIPEGYHYTVTEDSVSGFEVTSENAAGTIIGEQTVTASFTNTAVPPEIPETYGTLVLIKHATGVISNEPIIYDFTLRFTGLSANQTYTYTQEYASGTFGEASFTAGKDGTAVLDLKLSKDDKVTVPMLPDGSTAVATQTGAKDSVTSYTVESTTYNISHSADANRVVCKDLSTYSEPIAAENTKTLIFDDVMETKSTITVSKTVEGATTDQLFEFTIEFTGLKPNSTVNTDTAGRITADADGYAAKTFFLKNGEKLDITGVPAGAKFTVTETGVPDYKPSCTVKADDTVLSTRSADAAKSLTSEEATVKSGIASYKADFTNKYSKTHSLSITKKVAGNMGDKSKAFVFAVQMPESMYGKTVMTTKPDGSPAYTQVSSTGIINFTLKHGETITFSGLTDDEVTSLRIASEYGVSEKNYSKEGYRTTYKAAEENGNLSVAVTNTKTAGVPTGIHDVTGTEVMMIIGFIGLVLIALYSYSKYKDMRG